MNESELNGDELSETTSTPVIASSAATATRTFIHHPPRVDPDQYQADVPDWNPPHHQSMSMSNGMVPMMIDDLNGSSNATTTITIYQASITDYSLHA